MATEQDILAACIVDRNAYETFQLHATTDELTPLGQHWMGRIGSYYSRDGEASGCDIKLLKTLGLQSAGPQHAETLEGYYDSLPVVGASSQNIVASVLEYQRGQAGLQLAALLSNPGTATDKVRELVERYTDLLVACETGLQKLNYVELDDLEDIYDPSMIIPLFPKKIMEKKLLGGGAMPGHHILIFGRPEAGKSLFSIHQACGIANSGRKVLYCGNEESVKTHTVRAACNLANRNLSDYSSNSKEIVEIARKRGLENITFLDMDPGTLPELEMALRDVQPDAFVVDQVAGLEIGDSNPVNAVQKAARGVRTLGKRYGAVSISVGQAGDRTERAGQLPPTWLSMSDVYGSRTGVPAQVDLMFGLGYDEDMWATDVRAVSMPKNKLGGSHEGFKIRVDIQKSKIRVMS